MNDLLSGRYAYLILTSITTHYFLSEWIFFSSLDKFLAKTCWLDLQPEKQRQKILRSSQPRKLEWSKKENRDVFSEPNGSLPYSHGGI